jgi:hypothetical protein
MYNSYMFKDKLFRLTHKNTIYQSTLKLFAIFVTILVCKPDGYLVILLIYLSYSQVVKLKHYEKP